MEARVAALEANMVVQDGKVAHNMVQEDQADRVAQAAQDQWDQEDRVVQEDQQVHGVIMEDQVDRVAQDQWDQAAQEECKSPNSSKN
jgi:hypothetical protein